MIISIGSFIYHNNSIINDVQQLNTASTTISTPSWLFTGSICRFFHWIMTVMASNISLNTNSRVCKTFLFSKAPAWHRLIGLFCSMISFHDRENSLSCFPPTLLLLDLLDKFLLLITASFVAFQIRGSCGQSLAVAGNRLQFLAISGKSRRSVSIDCDLWQLQLSTVNCRRSSIHDNN